MNARCTTTSASRNASSSASGSRTSPWRYSIFVQPCSAGSNGPARDADDAADPVVGLQQRHQPEAEGPGRAGDGDGERSGGSGHSRARPYPARCSGPGCVAVRCERRRRLQRGVRVCLRRREMTKDRLSPLDASFLQLEDATSHMHVAAVLIFAGKPPPYERLLAHVESRLGLVPRYRQRVAEVPLAQARPRWVDDERFDLRYHVRNTALPEPGSEYELQVLAARVFSHHLRRDRPLWEMWLVEGLDRDRFAILSKTHHALVDGVSGLDILSVLFAPDEEESGPWRPEPAPSSAGLVTEALLERVTNAGELVRPLGAAARHPRKAVSRIAETVVGAGALAWAGVQPAPSTPYNAGQVGPDRRFTWTRASLDDVKAIKNTLGGTVNDVVLTVVTLALRRHLMRRGEDIDDLELKAFVPVSVRTEDQRGTLGNQVSGMLTTLPVSCADPVRVPGEDLRPDARGQALRAGHRGEGADRAQRLRPADAAPRGGPAGHAPAPRQPRRDQRAGTAVPALPRRPRDDRPVPDRAARRQPQPGRRRRLLQRGAGLRPRGRLRRDARSRGPGR